MRRVVTAELLDEDAGSPRQIASSLHDLERVNRWFGGVSTTLEMISRVLPHLRSTRVSLLDVGAGSGDVALAARRALASQGVQLEVTLLDRRSSHLVPRNGVRRVAADAMALPFSNNSFDLVTCGLLVHHLESDEVIRFANQALRVARTAVLLNDLRRSALSLALVYCGFPLFRSPLTRHDAPGSVRRAYTIDEMGALLARSTARKVEITPHYLFRMGAIVWK